MDLVMLVLVVAIIGFAVYLITDRVPMPPGWALALQVFALVLILLFVLRSFGLVLPNLLR